MNTIYINSILDVIDKSVLDVRAELGNVVHVLTGKHIFVRGGHGGTDVGASAGGVNEVDINYANKEELINMLVAKGAKVSCDGGIDENDKLTNLANIANSLEVDMVLDLHANWVSDKNVRGVLCVYYKSDNGEYESTMGKYLAKLIQDCISDASGIPKATNFGKNDTMVSKTWAVSNIIEYGFISNDDDRALLTNSEWRTKANTGIVDAVIAYFQ